MQGRNEQQAKQPKQGIALPQMPNLTGKFNKIVIAVIVAVVLVVTACSLPFWIAGVLGYNAISSGKPAISRNDPRRNDPRAVYDPLGCASRNMWVIAWNTPEGKRYGCTAKWK
jgi:hypothetical protein